MANSNNYTKFNLSWITIYSLIIGSIGSFLGLITFIFVDGDEILEKIFAMEISGTEILLSFFIGLLIFFITRYLKTRKSNAEKKRDDFIDTLKRVQKAQVEYTQKAFDIYTKNMLRELKSFKKSLNDAGIESTNKNFDFQIQEHLSHFKKPDLQLQKLLDRLERHKYGGIIEEIKADEVKKRIENESN